MPEHHPSALPKGHRIGEYEIVRVLGAGGFGITYLAFDHNLNAPVAIKEHFPARSAARAAGGEVVSADDEHTNEFVRSRDRFRDEARLLARLEPHPNIVRVHRYFEDNDTAYFVMDYAEGDSLRGVLDTHGALTPEQWRPWMDPILDGLDHLHRHGYLHRDIKPANIVIRSAADGRTIPVLVDFGAARVATQEQTHTQELTPRYAPMEQHSAHAVHGPPIDIYALAAVSYEALTGAPPPSAPDRMLDDRYEPLSAGVASADRAWLAAIDRGLSPQPADRPQTVTAWRAALIQANNEPAGTDARTAPSAAAQYPAAKPHFQKAWQHAKEAGKDLPAFIEYAVDQMLGAGIDVDTAYDTIGRFVEEQTEADEREAEHGSDRGPESPPWKARMTGLAAARTARLRTSFESNENLVAGRAGQRIHEAVQGTRVTESRFWNGCGSIDPVETIGPPETASRRIAFEPKPDSTRRDASAPQFESFSRLTGRTIAYRGAHAVPIDRDSPLSSHNGYVDLMEACYLEPCEEPELSLPEQEESLLMTFYSMYSALQCGDHGFDRLADEVLDSLGNEDDHDDYDAYESWRDEEFKEIEAHLVRGLERCGKDRTEVRGYVSSVDDWIAECEDLRDEPAGSDELESIVSEVEGSTEGTTQCLSASATWFDEWKKSEYAMDAFVDCIRRLRLLHENRFDAAKTRVERAIVEIAGPSR